MKISAFILFLIAETFFLYHIDYPSTHLYDEFHYVPSAKQILDGLQNQNWEHPPLGKIFISVGIFLWGDNPLGWRFMSTLSGAFTIVGMYLLAFLMFSSQRLALWVTLVTLLNQNLYVLSRVGLLDPFMACLMVWSMLTFMASMQPGMLRREVRVYLSLSGLFSGLAIACKWFAFILWLGLVVLGIGDTLFLRMKRKGSVRKGSLEFQAYRSSLSEKASLGDWLIAFGILPVTSYFLCFIPWALEPGRHLSISEILYAQYHMYIGQLNVITAHPYMSEWWTWASMTRPIWFAYTQEGLLKDEERSVLLIGNPLIMWGGLFAIFYCFKEWLKKFDRTPFLILYFYGSFYLSWAFIPRKTKFYYYYYPASLILSLALGFFLQSIEKQDRRLGNTFAVSFLLLSTGLFFYFYPILGAFKLPLGSFRMRMWWLSWI